MKEMFKDCKSLEKLDLTWIKFKILSRNEFFDMTKDIIKNVNKQIIIGIELLDVDRYSEEI